MTNKATEKDFADMMNILRDLKEGQSLTAIFSIPTKKHRIPRKQKKSLLKLLKKVIPDIVREEILDTYKSYREDYDKH